MKTMKIRKLDSGSKSDLREWRRFLSRCGSESLVFHTPEWKKFFEESFPKTKTAYYAVENEGENGEIALVFPFAFVKHPLFGKAAISCAFIEYGGPAGDANSEAVAAVIDEVEKEAKENGFDYVEIRHGLEKFDSLLASETKIIRETPYKRGLTKLAADSESVFASFDKEARKAVRKARSEGVETRELNEEDEPAAYELYLHGMKRFGSPPVHERFFKNFWRILVSKGLAAAFGAFKDGALASLLMGYTYGGRVHVIINVSDAAKQKYFPNDAVHWAFMEWACGNGFKEFDWGRVREASGQFQFKKKWGTEFKDLNHYFILGKAKTVPKIDPKNPKYALAISLWRRMPLFVSRRIGPWLREGMGI